MIIKEFPEDFIVEEIPNFDIKESADYSIYRLEKNSLNTEQAIDIICKKYNINRKDIKYAGTKDKNAITTQYISLYRNNRLAKNIDLLEGKLKLSFIGFLDHPLSLGNLSGNKFSITVKNITPIEKDNFHKRISTENNKSMPNYFDDQRFSKNNKDIGLAILKKDFKTAVELILKNSGRYEDILKQYIESNPKDYIGCIKILSRNILMMHLHSVQSFIFNQTLCCKLKEHAIKNEIRYFESNYSEGKLIFYESEDVNDSNNNNEKNNNSPISIYPVLSIDNIELVGFDSTLQDTDLNNIVKDLRLTKRDFIIRSIPNMSLEGDVRKAFVEIRDFSYEILKDNCIKIDFFLDKGSYATIVIKSLFT